MSESKNVPHESIDPEELKQAGHIVGNLLALLKAAHLYPKGHQMLLQAVEKFYSQLRQLLEKKQPVVLRIFENNLYALDLQITANKIPGSEDFIEELQKRYIRQIVFGSAASITDISALVGLLTTDAESISPLGGANAILSSHGAQGIKIVEYYFKRHTTLNQERLISLTNTELFRFLIDDTREKLDHQSANFLYELLRETALTCALVKVAAQCILREQKNPAPESSIILKILSKIRGAILSLDISEDSEIQTILRDIISSFEVNDFYTLIFDNPEHELISYSGAAQHLTEKLSAQKIAEMTTAKIIQAKESPEIISQTKTVLSLLFGERKAVLAFLPYFQEQLMKNIPSQNKAKRIINDICSSLAPAFSLESNIELSLGTISHEEKDDILAGLSILKTVPLEKETLSKRVLGFDMKSSYLSILQKLLSAEDDTALFIKTLDKITSSIQSALRQNDPVQARKTLLFLFDLLSDRTEILPAHRQTIIESLDSFPAQLLDGIIANILTEPEIETVRWLFQQLLTLFPNKLLPELIKTYSQNEKIAKAPLLKEIIISHYQLGALRLDLDLRKEKSGSAMRLLDIFQEIEGDDALPFLWETTFHENAIIAQRALKLLSLKNTPRSMHFLLKAAEGDNLPLRISGLEYLGNYSRPEAVSALAETARGAKYMSDDQETNITLRTTALRSLETSDRALAAEISAEILRNKRFFLFPVEPKKLRGFAAEQVKKLSSGQ